MSFLVYNMTLMVYFSINFVMSLPSHLQVKNNCLGSLNNYRISSIYSSDTLVFQ